MFSYTAETFLAIRILPHNQESFQIIQKLSRQSGNFLEYLETFQTIQKLFRQSENTIETFPDYPET